MAKTQKNSRLSREEEKLRFMRQALDGAYELMSECHRRVTRQEELVERLKKTTQGARRMLTLGDSEEIEQMITDGWSLVGPLDRKKRWVMKNGKPDGDGETIMIHAFVARYKARRMAPYKAVPNSFWGWG